MQSFPAALRIMNPVATLVGADNSLAAINTSLLPDGSVVLVTATHKLYVLDKASVQTQSLPSIVVPAEGGTGAWLQLPNGASEFQALSLVHAAVPPQSSVDTSVTIANGGVPITSTDIIDWNLTDSLLPLTLSIGNVRITGTNTATFRFSNLSAATVAAGTVAVEAAIQRGG